MESKRAPSVFRSSSIPAISNSRVTLDSRGSSSLYLGLLPVASFAAFGIKNSS